MAKFEIAYPITAKAEGGWINDPSDTGGQTYCGISRKNFPAGELWGQLAKHQPLRNGEIVEDDAVLTNMVMNFYRGNFWNAIQGDKIINQDVANDLYDSAVNMGVHQAVILSQRSLGISETGHMDDVTLRIINNANPNV